MVRVLLPLLAGCPWVGADLHGLLSETDGIDDTEVDTEIAPACPGVAPEDADTTFAFGTWLVASTCGGPDAWTVPVRPGCRYDVAVEGAVSVDVVDGDGQATGLSRTASDAEDWTVEVWGEPADYSLLVRETCPPCAGGTTRAEWNEPATGSVCAAFPEFRFSLPAMACDFGIDVHTVPGVWLALDVGDDTGSTRVSSDNGLLSIAGTTWTSTTVTVQLASDESGTPIWMMPTCTSP